LVLYGAYAKGRAVRAVNEEEKRAASLDLDLARVGWGRDDPAFRQVFAAQFLPDGTRADWAAFDQLQRRTTSPDNAVRFLTEFGRIDVCDEARDVQCPTVVLHSRDDHRVPLRFGEELAALIPDARLVTLDSKNHLLTDTEPAWQVFRAEVGEFLAC
jgi:pimeloyl-ACP methyl ester carboxylesterase